MKFIEEPKRQIPVVKKTDVLVLGAGPAGFSAAVNAARMNTGTMLIEQAGAVGGVATSGLMSHWSGNTAGGFYDEILTRTHNRQLAEKDARYRQVIDHENLKLTMLDMLSEAKVALKLYTFASAPIMEDERITGVIIESKSGRQAIMAKVVIDATGDGDIAAKAGAPYFKGRESDGKMQPMTLMIQVGGVDPDRVMYNASFESTYPIPAGDLQTVAKEKLPHPAGHVLIYHSALPGSVVLNMTNCIDVDGTNADGLTRAEYECRRQIPEIIKFMRNHVPGFENCYLMLSAPCMGVRETRHFIGENTITEDDIKKAAVFENWAVTKAHFNFDVHNLDGSGLDKTGIQKHFSQNKGYTIPYGCFVPKKIDNLLLAGRNISGTHMAHSSFRVMPICANIGQAVGIAAALCVKGNILPRNLEASLLQKELKSVGVDL